MVVVMLLVTVMTLMLEMSWWSTCAGGGGGDSRLGDGGGGGQSTYWRGISDGPPRWLFVDRGLRRRKFGFACGRHFGTVNVGVGPNMTLF